MAKSIGSEKFSHLPVTAAKKALALTATLPTISRYCGGQRTPNQEVRELIRRLWPGAPEPFEWDELLEPPPVPEVRTPDSGSPEPATPESVTREADAWLHEVKGLREELALLTDAGERARLMADASRVLATLGKLTGANLSASRAQILASPHWREIMGVITVALEPWPEAARAIQVALDPQESENPTKASAPGRAQ